MGTDLRQVVVMVGGVGVGAGTERQHRAAVEVEDEPVGLVDRGDPQGHQPGGRPARLGGILLQPDDLGAGEQGVADAGKLDPLRRIDPCPPDLAEHQESLYALHRRLDEGMALIESFFERTTLGQLLAGRARVHSRCARS